MKFGSPAAISEMDPDQNLESFSAAAHARWPRQWSMRLQLAFDCLISTCDASQKQMACVGTGEIAAAIWYDLRSLRQF